MFILYLLSNKYLSQFFYILLSKLFSTGNIIFLKYLRYLIFHKNLVYFCLGKYLMAMNSTDWTPKTLHEHRILLVLYLFRRSNSEPLQQKIVVRTTLTSVDDNIIIHILFLYSSFRRREGIWT